MSPWAADLKADRKALVASENLAPLYEILNMPLYWFEHIWTFGLNIGIGLNKVIRGLDIEGVYV